MGTVQIDGSTPKITVGNATAEDATILFDGNAQDFYIALDDSADDLLIGLGSTVGTTPMLSFTEAKAAAFTGAVTMASTLGVTGVVTGAGFTAGSAVLAEAELELLDGLTAGTAIASKVVTTDANIDTTGQRNLTISGELDAATLDISGNADIDGTTNLDAVDIDGAVQLDSTLTIGADDTGHDVIFYGATAGAKLFWDESADDLILDKTIFKMDQTDGNYIYLYRGGSKALVGNITDEGDASGIGLTIYNSDEDFIFKYNNTTESFRIGASGGIFASATKVSTGGETAPDVDTGGLCLNTGAADAKTLTFKSSDVAHNMTGLAEADTYGLLQKRNATEGGLLIRGFSEGVSSVEIKGAPTSASTTLSTGGNSPVMVNTSLSNGSGDVTAMSSNGVLFGVANDSTFRFAVDAEGDLHYDGGTNATAWDRHDDAHMVRALDLSHGVNTIDSKFDKFVGYNHEKLAEMKLVGREEDGTPNHFINITGLQRLHNGAIWQQYEKHNQLLEAVYDLAKVAVGEKKANAILDKHEVKRLQ